MYHHSDEIIYCVRQIVGSKWCIFVVRKKVIPINLYSSGIILEKRYITEGGGDKNLRQGRPQSEPKTGSEGGNLTN